MRGFMAVLLGAFMLSGCAWLGEMLGTEFNAQPSRALSTKPCPPLVEYSEFEQGKAAAELESLPDGAVLPDMMDDYLFMRDACR